MPSPAPYRVAIESFGCRVNRYDAAFLHGALAARGYDVVAAGEPADVVVVNSCTVTGWADHEARNASRRGARSGALVVMTGCLAERDPEGAARVPGVGLVVRGGEKTALAERLDQALGRTSPPATAEPLPHRGDARFFLKVQEGCDVRCTFCVVPDARGPGRSVPADAIVGTLVRASDAGFVEAILAGVHLGSWGRDLPGRPTLGRLCRRVLDETGLARLRLGSLEPWGVRDDLLDLLRGEPRFLPSLALPLQSGSDRLLRAMRRPITAAGYRRAAERVLEARPETTLFVDVLVGFPGETDADFAATRALLDALPWTKLHVFSYSPRPGTPAASLPGRVPGEVVRARVRELCDASDARFAARLATRAGSRDEVVAERGGTGHTRDNLPVTFHDRSIAPGRHVAVRVTGVDAERRRLVVEVEP